MKLDILLRGQSNSIILGWAEQNSRAISAEVQRLLGFDGFNDTVSVQFEWLDPSGRNTSVGGTKLIGDWLTPTGGGWQVNTLEQGLLNYVNALPPATRAEPTVVLWLHNEDDSRDPGLTAATWTSAVRYDAALVRAAYGRADIPYIFVEPIPYVSGTDAGAQAIRLGMSQLVADTSFNAQLTASNDDLDMSAIIFGGGGHMTDADAAVVASRSARTIAESFAAYAKPGSLVAAGGGNIDDMGPLAVRATASGTKQLIVTFQHDAASSLAPLDAAAATGLGWTVRAGNAVTQATGATITGPNTLVLSFAADLPAGGTLHYGYGNTHLVSGGTARGHAVYDNQGMPASSPAAGLSIMPLLASHAGDFNGDGRDDVLWRGQAGEAVVWALNGGAVIDGGTLPGPGAYWTAAGTGDFNGDGRDDALWRGQAGETAIWALNGATIIDGGTLPNPGGYWTVAGTGDFNGDGRDDILWRGQAGEAVVWALNGATIVGGSTLPGPGAYWTVA